MLFNPGTGTLKSTTLEAALIEAAVMLQIYEESARSEDPTIPDTVAVNFFTGDKTVTLNIASMPVSAIPTASGVAYQGNYENIGFPTFSNAGTDLLATSLPAAVTELALRLEQDELNQPTAPNKATSSINTNTNTFNFSVELNVSMTQTSTGATQFTPVAYLL